MLSHEEHIARLSDLVSSQEEGSDACSLFDDNLSMVVADVLQSYSPFREADHEFPVQWYVVGVMMYALGETSRKPLPVNLVSLGTLVKRVRERMRERGGDVSRDEILAIANLFSLGLFKHCDADKGRIADVLRDYISAVLEGTSHGDR